MHNEVNCMNLDRKPSTSMACLDPYRQSPGDLHLKFFNNRRLLTFEADKEILRRQFTKTRYNNIVLSDYEDVSATLQ